MSIVGGQTGEEIEEKHLVHSKRRHNANAVTGIETDE